VDEIELKGEVTVPDPFPAAQTPFLVQLGGKSLQLKPDANGLCVDKEAVLLLTNTSLSGNGIVRGGTARFELTLKGAEWVKEMQKTMKPSAPGGSDESLAFPLALKVGEAQHRAMVQLARAGG
jgi:hypothetical protein